MSADFEIETLPDGILFRVRRRHSIGDQVWAFVLGVTLLYVSVSLVAMPSPWLRGLLSFAGGFAAALWRSRSSTIETRFKPDGVRVRKPIASGFYAPRWTPLSAISELMWQAEWSSGPDVSYSPSGLYARTRYTSVCLVPHIDAVQARRAIDSIESSFHWIDREDTSQNSLLFEADFVRLGLDRNVD